MLHSLNEFKTPFDFSHTGFDRSNANKSFETNIQGTLAVQRPCPSGRSSVVFRAFSELDLRQVEYIDEIVRRRQGELTENDIESITPMTLTRVFGRETFFSLFFEINAIYNIIINSVMNGAFKAAFSSRGEYETFLRILSFIIARPIPINVEVTNP